MKIYDEKTKKTSVVYNEYKIGNGNSCPECGRIFKDYDEKRLQENSKISCVKCGAKLVR